MLLNCIGILVNANEISAEFRRNSPDCAGITGIAVMLVFFALVLLLVFSAPVREILVHAYRSYRYTVTVYRHTGTGTARRTGETQAKV